MTDLQTSFFVTAKSWPMFLLLTIVGAWTGLAGAWIQAAETGPSIESVQVGFRGVVEAGRWTPIRVAVRGPAGAAVAVRVVATDVEGRPVEQAGPEFSLNADTTEAALVYQHGPLNSPVRVELLAQGSVVSTTVIRESIQNSPLSTKKQQNQLVFCLGSPQIGYEDAARISNEFEARHPDQTEPLTVQHYSQEQLTELPTDVRGWEAVDLCAISADCQIPAPLGRVIDQWVRQGGRVVLTGGEAVSSVTSPGLSNWLPIRIDGEVNQHDLSSLKLLTPAGSTLRLLMGNIKTVRWVTDQGWFPAQSLDGPLIARSAHGQGIVTAIALDLNARPFVSAAGDEIEWESLHELCRWLAGFSSLPKLQANQLRPQSDLNPTGVSDLQSQLVNALDQFPELRRPSYWLVLSTALLFLAIIGPLDWLLVHRVLKKPHLTWVTLPIWIGLGTFIGLSAAQRISGGAQLTRQVDMLTCDLATGETQFDSWLSLTSHEHHRYSVKCDAKIGADQSPVPARLRWAGRPEQGFRGLYRPSNQTGSGAKLELREESQAVTALPIRHGDSTVLEAKTQSDQPLPVTFDLYDNGQRHLVGTLSHQLPGELTDWVVAYEGFAYMPARSSGGIESPLRPGESVDVDKIPSRLVADYLGKVVSRALNRPDGKSRDYTLSRTAYDPLSKNVYELLKTVTYNQLAGGRSYTGLSNVTLQNEDLSRLVVSRRAVLFGRLRSPAYSDDQSPITDSADDGQLLARYTIDGQPLSPRYRECFVRVILPVRSDGNPPP